MIYAFAVFLWRAGFFYRLKSTCAVLRVYLRFTLNSYDTRFFVQTDNTEINLLYQNQSIATSYYVS